MRLLEGLVVGVTGGSSGIGRAICIAAARHGANCVLIASRSEQPREGGAPTADEVQRLGVQAHFIRTDVSQQDQVEAFVSAADEFGGLDVMVCNAGIALPNDTVDIPSEDYRRLMAVNLDGVFFSAQAAGRSMRARGRGGSIVLIASVGGVRGSAVTVAYGASKGGVTMMARSMADGFGPHGIRVNAICPGIIETELVKSSPAVEAAVGGLVARTPLRRMGQPTEIGDTVAWLGSDLSSFVTGTALLVDGGLASAL